MCKVAKIEEAAVLYANPRHPHHHSSSLGEQGRRPLHLTPCTLHPAPSTREPLNPSRERRHGEEEGPRDGQEVQASVNATKP